MRSFAFILAFVGAVLIQTTPMPGPALAEQAAKAEKQSLPVGALARLGKPRGENFFDLTGISTVAFSADGKKVATSSGYHGITIWEAESGRKITHLRMLDSKGEWGDAAQWGTEALSFSPDPKHIIWSVHSRIGASEIATGKEVWREQGSLFAATPDGKLITTGFHAEPIRILDARTGKLLHKLADGKWWMNYRMALSDDGKTLAGVGETTEKVEMEFRHRTLHRIEIWDVATGKLRKVIEMPAIDTEIMNWDFKLAPDGKTIMYTMANPGFRLGIDAKYQVVFADTQTGKERADLVKDPPAWTKVPRSHGGERIVYSPDAKRRVTFGPKSALNVWDTAKDRLLPASEGIRGPVQFIAFAADGKILVSGGSFYNYVWDVSSKTLKERLDKSKPTPNLDPSVAGRPINISPDGKLIARIVGNDIHIRELPGDKLVEVCEGHKGKIHALVFSGDGSRLLSASHTRPPPSQEIPRKPGKIPGAKDKKEQPAPIPDDTMRLWEAKTGKLIRQWDLHVTWSQLSADGKTFFFATRDRLGRIDAATGKELPAFKGRTGDISAVQLSADKSRIALQNGVAEIVVYDTGTAKELKRLPGTVFALSPDGRILATSGASHDDTTILLWGLARAKDKEGQLKPAAPLEMNPKVVQAWTNAGAKLGWCILHKTSGLILRSENDNSPEYFVSLPMFWSLDDATPATFAKLPTPDVPFCLSFNSIKTGDTKVIDAWLKELARFKNLQGLCLERNNVTEAGFADIGKLENLQILDLARTPLTDKGMKELVRLKNLRFLHIMETPVTDDGLKELAGLKKMEVLYLLGTRVSDAGMKTLAGHHHLRVLLLNERITDDGLAELAGLRKLQSLQIASPITDEGLKYLEAFDDLERLRLYKTKVTDAGLKDLAHLTKLQDLNLDDSPVTGTGFKALAGLENLQEISLVGTKFSDAGLKELAKLKNVRRLYLHFTNVGDEGLKELALLKHLEVLYLEGTYVTDAGLKVLAGIKSLKTLFMGDTDVTVDGAAELRRLRPEMYIQHTPRLRRIRINP